MSTLGRILVIDDDALMQELIRTSLQRGGFECDQASSCSEGLERARGGNPDAILCDVMLPDGSGVDLLDDLRPLCPDSAVFMVSSSAYPATAVEAFRRGAFDFFYKPLDLAIVSQRIQRYLEGRALAQEVTRLRRGLAARSGDTELVGRSARIREIQEVMHRLAETGSNLLITGESGTGKEIVARGVHAATRLGDQPFVSINCAAISAELCESELFGHRRGAFTGALEDKEGLFAAADGGTLFLDEISETSIDFQTKLLRVIEQKAYVPVGDTRLQRFQARIIASSNRDLPEWIAAGRFRQDLYYRLRVVEIRMPPLRSRREDIPLLVEHFIRRLNPKLTRYVLGVHPQALRLLMAYSWPGNVRELENVLERAMILGESETIQPADLPADIAGPQAALRCGIGLREALRAYEREYLRQMLEECQGDKVLAARKLEINLATLYRKMTDLGMKPRRAVPRSVRAFADG